MLRVTLAMVAVTAPAAVTEPAPATVAEPAVTAHTPARRTVAHAASVPR
jgi:hypothetical protein